MPGIPNFDTTPVTPLATLPRKLKKPGSPWNVPPGPIVDGIYEPGPNRAKLPAPPYVVVPAGGPKL